MPKGICVPLDACCVCKVFASFISFVLVHGFVSVFDLPASHKHPIRAAFQCVCNGGRCGCQIDFKPVPFLNLCNLCDERRTHAAPLIIRQHNKAVYALFALLHRHINDPGMTYKPPFVYANILRCRRVQVCVQIMIFPKDVPNRRFMSIVNPVYFNVDCGAVDAPHCPKKRISSVLKIQSGCNQSIISS